jgi:hypothetical protein
MLFSSASLPSSPFLVFGAITLAVLCTRMAARNMPDGHAVVLSHGIGKLHPLIHHPW